MPTKRMKVKDLDLTDTRLYPRNGTSSAHIMDLVDALEAGIILPAIIVCAVTKKVIDGYHRCMAYLKYYGEDAEVEVILKNYRNDRERHFDAGWYNRAHGMPLDRRDRAQYIIVARELGQPIKKICEALGMRASRIDELVKAREAIVKNGDAGDHSVALKGPLTHLAGKTIDKETEKVNKGCIGLPAVRYVRTLIGLLTCKNGIDLKNEKVLQALAQLKEVLDQFLAKHSVSVETK